MTTLHTPTQTANEAALQHFTPLPQDLVTEVSVEIAKRIISRTGFDITGFVFTHPRAKRKAILDGDKVRWLTADDLTRVMKWEQPIGSGEPPAGFVVEATAQAPAADSSLASLAKELGCEFNDSGTGIAAWTVPGKEPASFSSPADAIRHLAASLRAAANAPVPGHTEPLEDAKVYDSKATAAEPQQPGLF